MKVLLINPQRNLKNPHTQFASPPVGLAGLASYLQLNGYETELVDMVGEDLRNYELLDNGIYRCGMGNNKLIKIVENFKPDVVGISCSFTPRLNNVLEIARRIKQYNRNIITIVGGMHATTSPETLLSKQTIDYVIMGEGEIPLFILLEKLRVKESPTDIKGISFRQNGKIMISRDRALLDVLETLPMPAYELLPMEKYFRYTKRDNLMVDRRHTSVITSRGCPFNCSFCSSAIFWGQLWRARHFMHVLTELELLVENYKVREIAFEDDNMSLDKPRMMAMCGEMIHRNLNLRWSTPNGIHIATLDLELIRIMKKSGCVRLNFGIESGDEAILANAMNKKIDLAKTKEVIRMCHEEGIITLGYFILGMPGETPQSLEKTIAYAKSLALDEIGLFIATPFPKTVLEASARTNGYLKKEYTGILAEDDIESRVFIETPMLSTEKLLYYKQLFIKEFYKKKIRQNPLYYCKRVLRSPKLLWKR